MKIIITCAGKSSRCGTELPKHVYEIQGKQNIKRTIDLLVNNKIKENDIIITTSKDNNKYFNEINIKKYIGSNEREIDRYRNIYEILDNEKTIVLYGDVVFHKKDLENILEIQSNKNIFFGRLGKNKITKKLYGEIFGVVVNDKEKFVEDTNKTAKLFEQKKIQRELGWDVYRVSGDMDLSMGNVKGSEYFFEVSDYTDDYDDLNEYKIIKEIYKGIE